MTKKHVKEMNLFDNYLFYEVMSDPVYGVPAAKIILSILMGRKIEKLAINPEKLITPGNNLNHAVRLDVYAEEVEIEVDGSTSVQMVYDLEVQNDSKLDELPKRSRYIQSLMDKKLLSAGRSYKELPPTWVIFLTKSDFIGEGRMFYTFEDRCVENLKLPLYDGARKLFINSEGLEGRTEELGNLMDYLVSSQEERARDSTTKELHEMVDEIRLRPEVEERYMIWAAYEQDLKDEGREQTLLDLTRKKIVKGKSVEVIADELEITVSEAKKLITRIETEEKSPSAE